jgi:hypothetical protein
MKNLKRNALIVIVLLVVAALLGLRVTHPKGGLSNALGPAHSGIAVYLKTNKVGIGDKVVYQSQDTKINPALGAVFGENPKYVDIKNGKYLEGIYPKDVNGKLPFIGWILG